MIKKDYILQIIEEIANFLKDINRLLNDEKIEDAETYTDEVMQKFLGLSADTIKILPYEQLISFMRMDREIGNEKCIVLGVLLTKKGDIAELKNDFDESYNYYLKALNILTEVFDKDEDERLKEHFSKIDYLIDKLQKYEFSNELNDKIIKYYEFSGKYDKAEDMIYDSLGENNWDKTLIIEGINFYERLLNKKENELVKGNLPIDEVKQGLAILKEKLT